MGLKNSGYRKWYTFYNSERRDAVGGIYSFIRYQPYPSSIQYGYQWDFRNTYASVQEFTLDLSNTSANNPITVTMFTLSNGCKIKGTFYYDGYSDSRGWSCYGALRWYDINDNLLFSQFTPAGGSFWCAKKYYADLSAVKIWFNPPAYQYQLDRLAYGDLANYFTWCGGFFELIPNSSPYDPPTIANGEVYDNNNLSIYYNYHTSYITDDATYDAFISGLKNGGDDTPISPLVPSEDISGVGGGDSANPDYNPFSDPINFPDLPTGGSALASGFIKIYRPTSGELNQLAAKLWSDSFFEEIKKIQNDPLEAIISLHSVPFAIVGASRQNCRIGNYDSEIAMDTIAAQFYTVDCGNIAIPEHWASALDYAPYTDIEIYLPFCGVKPLQIDDIMNRVINVKYNIDILTGAAICMVKCGDSVLYTYNTEIAQNIPMSASNHAQLYQSIISAASAVVGVASGGAGAVVGALQSAATVAASKHGQVSRGGSLGGSVGVLGDFVPYLIIHRPIQSLAADFAHKKGYPSNITATLSSVSGYTEVDSIHLENIPCTDMEREELYRILQEGVIL